MDDQRLNTIEQRLADNERWRGSVDQRMNEHERRLTSINGSVSHSAEALANVALELAKLSTREQTAAQARVRWAGWVVPTVFSTFGAVIAGIAVFLLTTT